VRTHTVKNFFLLLIKARWRKIAVNLITLLVAEGLIPGSLSVALAGRTASNKNIIETV